MTNPTSFDNEPEAISGQPFNVRTQILELNDARENQSFANPIALYDKWLTLPEVVPHYKQITPSFVGANTLPEMYIIDVLGDSKEGYDFRWRLFGTEHSNRYGREATGILLSEAARSDDSAAGSYRVAKQVMDTLEPAFFLTEFLENNVVVKTTSTVVMPLSDDEGKIVRLFGCSAWSRL